MSQDPTLAKQNLRGDAPGAPSVSRLRFGAALLVGIAVADAFSPRFNLSPLYIIPLILLSQIGVLRPAWRVELILAILIYASYFIKRITFYPGEHLFTAGLVNRTLVVLMLLSVSEMLRKWFRWQAERRNPEMPDQVRAREDKLHALLAIATSISIAASIAIADLALPVYFNPASLYPVPLFISVLARNRLLLWSLLVVCLVLTVLGYTASIAPDLPIRVAINLIVNRCLSAMAMIVTAVILDRWLASDRLAAV